jgi:uncharacterized protein (TIGR03435 family)
MRYAIKIVSVALLCFNIAHAQSARPQFEVASVKANKLFHLPAIKVTGDRFVATNVTLTAILQYAYNHADGPLLDKEIAGAPGWAGTDRFDIEAKSGADGDTIPAERVRRMVQSLLEDRFQLKVHWDRRELPVYTLVVAKHEKLRLSDDQTTPPQEPAARASSGEIQRERVVVQGVGIFLLPLLQRGQTDTFDAIKAMVIRGHAIPIESLAKLLEGQLGYPLHDKTDLKGLFDIQLQFAKQGLAPADGLPATGTPQATAPSLPSLSTALQEQLGLKLESSKGPVDVLVIDSVSKPTEN